MVSACRNLLRCAFVFGAFAASYAGSIAEDSVRPLRDWKNMISKSLEHMDQIQSDATACHDVGVGGRSARDWALGNCDSLSADACQPSIIIRQNVQRFGRTRQVIADENVDELMGSINGSLQAERLELEQKERQLKQMIGFAEGVRGHTTFSDAEVRDQARRAKVMASSFLGRVEVFLAVPSKVAGGVLNGFSSCRLTSLEKPSSMFSNPSATEANAVDEHGDPLLLAADLSHVHSRSRSIWANSLFLADDWTQQNNQWAGKHKLIAYLWLYAGSWATMVPCSGSGPFMPEASSNFASIGFLPWWNMFGPEVSCASPVSIISGANPGASSWSQFSEFGLLTFSPGPMARASCWMIPGIGAGGAGQIIPGRLLPDRTVCGSHPSGCSNLEGRPSTETQATFLAPRAEAYDEDLVQLLYSLAAQNISFGKATFYTTSLSQLAILGFYPQDHALQHHGVQLTLKENFTGMPTQLGSKIGEATSGARVLTLEMMTQGLLWSLRQKELAADEVHSTEAYQFHAIQPEVVADYILDQKGTTYRDANCQAYASGLMDRILFHGIDLKSTESILGLGASYTWRFIGLLCLAVVAIVVSLGAQWTILARSALHMRAKGDKRNPLTSLRDVVEELADDMKALERYCAGFVGERAAHLARRFTIGALMWQSPPVFWYVVVKYWNSKKTVVSEQQEAFLAGAEAM